LWWPWGASSGVARGEEALSATAAEVQSLGGQPVALEYDVADPQAVEAAADELERHDEVEVWVNNAMASVFAPTWELSKRLVGRLAIGCQLATFALIATAATC
jgi:short-subunit dehydrogenase